MSWLEEIIEANHRFKKKVSPDALPTQRRPGPYAIITCMDPRVNPAAAGIRPFKANGDSLSDVRVIRTLGGIAENRSLLVGIHLAGFKEIAVIMHTDCGLSLAHEKTDVLINNMQANLSPEKMSEFKGQIGEPFRENLRKWLHAFADPRQAVIDEIKRIRALPFVPDGLILHGLIYQLASGALEIIVNGYQAG